MAVVYAKLWPDFAGELRDTLPGMAQLSGWSLLFFDPVLERVGTTSVGQRLRQVDAAVRETDIIVIRSRDDEVVRTAGGEVDVLRRLSSARSGYALFRQTAGSPPTLAPLFGPVDRNLISAVDFFRCIEFEAIIRRTGALFRDPRVHYLVPSQDHAEGFLRFADALHDPTEVGRFADWILPHITGNSVFIGDNGSLLSLLLVVREMVHRTMGLSCHLRTLSEYPLTPEPIERLLDDVVTRHPKTPIIFLVSVHFSGRLTHRILAVAPPGTKIVVLCNTGDAFADPRISSLYDLPIARFELDTYGKCEECAAKPIVGIDSRTYERIPDLTYEARKIDVAAATRHRDFWQSADRANAVKLHYNLAVSDREVRHHSVYLDIAALLKEPWFRVRVREALAALTPPNLILVPDHGASDAVIDVLRDSFPHVSTLKVGRGPLSEELTAHIKQLGVGALILVADDALVQGTTLRGLRHQIYQVTQLMQSAPKLKAFVCLARPDNDETFRNAARMYQDQDGPQLSYAYRLYLPSSGEKYCPWCQQRRLLLRIT